MNAIDISPEACAARKARILASQRARFVRAKKLSDARALIRSAQLKNESELLQALQNVHASIDACTTASEGFAARLLALITDMDAELNEGEPELPDLRKVGELDCYSPRRSAC